MKRFLIVLFTIVLIPTLAFAEENAIDITPVFTGLIALVFAIVSVFGTRAYNNTIKPWLEDHHLTQAAAVAVQAAEALYGRYHGEEKLKYAIDNMNRNGWSVDSDIVIDAIRSAWFELNENQIAIGEKEMQEVSAEE